MVRGIWGEPSRSPGSVAAVGRAWRRCSSSSRLLGASSSSQGQHTRDKAEWQGEIIPNPALLPVTWGHQGTIQELFGWKSRDWLPCTWGESRGLVGFKRLLRVGKHMAEPRQDLEQFTPCPHTWAVCCRFFRCCSCIPHLQGSAEIEGKGG